jgi:hypothetical protein
MTRWCRAPRLADIVSDLALIGCNDLGLRLETWLDHLDATGRWALLKLLTGAVHVSMSARLATTAAMIEEQGRLTPRDEGWQPASVEARMGLPRPFGYAAPGNPSRNSARRK